MCYYWIHFTDALTCKQHSTAVAGGMGALLQRQLGFHPRLFVGLLVCH